MSDTAIGGKYALDGLDHELFRRLIGTMCHTRAVLDEGTNSATFKTTTNICHYSIKGIMYQKAATDNLAFSAGHTVVPASSTCLFAVCLNAAGTVSTVQGRIHTTADLSTGDLLCPDVEDDDLCMIGIIKVVTDGSTTFTAGTTDLGAAGITDTYYNVATPPLHGTLG